MSEHQIARINRAVNSCLNRCYATDQPLAELADFIFHLRNSPHWNDADITLVETRVLRMLKLVQNPSDAESLA